LIAINTLRCATGRSDAFDHRLVIEIQAGEIARVGVVAVAEIDRVGAVVDRRLERRQAAGGTNQLGNCGARMKYLVEAGQ
jgi:hypothetical protein